MSGSAPRDPRGTAPVAHWDGVYAERGPRDVSWYEETPAVSARLVLRDGVPASVIDVGAGASTLPDALLDAGVGHVTLLDLSLRALSLTAARLDERSTALTTIAADVLTYAFEDVFDVWHDRAVFHFLTSPEQQAAYVAAAAGAVRPGGTLVLGAFAPDGPESCSGLPVQRWSSSSLAEAFGSAFDLEHTEQAEHHTPWDAVQPFTWVVLRRR
ncbi:class I SAM-dependent methyltransferase [Nocardioides bruguierae]|uniref:class I SAM-dependent methyltransferase n=1 Tax=Nocardioides bruguierae TaxID=2945102 RepID=UPI00202047BD|nr:class I SAM-dependent methyltransferase [Nocardioides bruguierae]MCL8026053.1 class I SAM-dependent methyltransferase [Nocardioides bruguierae]